MTTAALRAGRLGHDLDPTTVPLPGEPRGDFGVPCQPLPEGLPTRPEMAAVRGGFEVIRRWEGADILAVIETGLPGR